MCDGVHLPRQAIHAGGVGRDAGQQKLQLLVHLRNLRREVVDFPILTLDDFEHPRLSMKGDKISMARIIAVYHNIQCFRLFRSNAGRLLR